MVFPIQLDGSDLGKRHKQLNTLTNELIAKKLALEQIKDIPETGDVERLLKIDVASAQRNVEYILYNLQSHDMLYVSRALRSTWLIKDQRYIHIINPQYLHNRLFPLMINRAVCKLKLTIRLHLKGENRCEEFFQYYFDNNDKRHALLFLSLCSEKFILNKLQQNKLEIPVHLVKRLCEKVPTAAQEIIKNGEAHLLTLYLNKPRFLARSHTEFYLDLVEKYFEDYWFYNVNLGRRSTFAILQHYQERVLGKLKHYMRILHLPTVAEVLGPIKVKEVIVKLSKNPDVDDWFSYKNIQLLLKAVNHNEKYNFLKSIFEERENNKAQRDIALLEDDCPGRSKEFVTCKGVAYAAVGSSISNVYEWYRYAPFPTAFLEVKKLIRTEPQSDERLAMLKVLIDSAKENASHTEHLLHYFHNCHINEPKYFREKFVKNLLKSTQAFRYSDACWKILEELFHNLEVYVEGSPYYEDCVETIMLYHMLRDSPIPNIILAKWHDAFSTLQPMAKKLKPDEKEKVFGLLYVQLKAEINKLSLDNSDDLHKVIRVTNNSLELLKKWKQPLDQHPDLLELLKIVIHKAQAISILEPLKYYGQDKKWNRLLFSDALLILQTQDVFINTLKHDPDLLKKHEVQLRRALEADNKNLDRFLSKLRIYFCNDLAVEWIEKLKGRLGEVHGKCVSRAICILMHRDSFSELVKMYVPHNYKIKWSEESAAQLNLRKYFAQQMYLVRPLANVTDILAFAKGDYLQYALPSLNFICFQLPASRCSNLLPDLLEETVSIQKFAIRLAFAKLSSSELQDLFPKLWKQVNNASLRAVIFKLTYEMLCQEKEEDEMVQIWELLQIFISNLTTDKDRSIYSTLGKAQNVPERIRPDFCTVSYRFLKTVPEKMNCFQHIYKLFNAMPEIIDKLDNEFVYEIINTYFKLVYVEEAIYIDETYYNKLWYVFEEFLFACKSEVEQLEKYSKVGQAFVNHTKDFWYISKENRYSARAQFQTFIEHLAMRVKKMILVRNRKYITPLPLLRHLLSDVEAFLPFHEYICIHVNLQLIIVMLESYDSFIDDLAEVLPDDTFLNREMGKRFGLKCGALYEDSSAKLFPSFLGAYCKIVNNFIDNYLGYKFDSEDVLFNVSTADALSMDPNNVPYVLLSIAILPSYCHKEVEAEYAKVFQRLQAMDNTEIKLHFNNTFNVNKKFTNSP